MNTIIAAALATVTLAAVPKYLEAVNKTSALAEDCKYITEEAMKDAAALTASMKKCATACSGAKEGDAEKAAKMTDEEKKKAMEEAAKKLKEMTKEDIAKLQACPTNCTYCTNYSSASNLVLGAAAVATAMALF